MSVKKLEILSTPESKVAWLDGYLCGLSSVDGEINEYFASSFLIKSNNFSAPEAVIKFFSPGAVLKINSIKSVEPISWIKYVEPELSKLLLRKPMGSKDILEADIRDRCRSLTFRVIDLIEEILDAPSDIQIDAFQGFFDGSMESCNFFSFSIGENYLILQFMRH